MSKVVGRAMREYVADTIGATFPSLIGAPLSRPPTPRPGATAPSDLDERRDAFQTQLAAVYRLAQSRELPVIDSLMTFYGVSKLTARAWLQETRAAGHLPTTERQL